MKLLLALFTILSIQLTAKPYQYAEPDDADSMQWQEEVFARGHVVKRSIHGIPGTFIAIKEDTAYVQSVPGRAFILSGSQLPHFFASPSVADELYEEQMEQYKYAAHFSAKILNLAAYPFDTDLLPNPETDDLYLIVQLINQGDRFIQGELNYTACPFLTSQSIKINLAPDMDHFSTHLIPLPNNDLPYWLQNFPEEINWESLYVFPRSLEEYHAWRNHEDDIDSWESEFDPSNGYFPLARFQL